MRNTNILQCEQFPYHSWHTCRVDSNCQASGCLAAQQPHADHQHSLALDMALEDTHTPEGVNSSLLGHDGLEAGSCQLDSSHPHLDMSRCCNFYLKHHKTFKLVHMYCTTYHETRWKNRCVWQKWKDQKLSRTNKAKHGKHTAWTRKSESGHLLFLSISWCFSSRVT
jgi:hypothetical protein